MRVFDETKTIELTEYNLYKGYLKEDKRFIAFHPSVEAVQEQGHYETIAEYPNGGKDVKWVIDVPAVEAKESYEEYEDIQVYIPYTEGELEKQKKKAYPILVEQYIREKYSLSDELAILRQRDTKPAEFIEYDVYAETCKTRAKEELKNIYK